MNQASLGTMKRSINNIVRDQKNGGKLYQLLCHQNKTDRKSDGNQHRRHEIPNRVEIDECL